MPTCPACGSPASDGARFCSDCGAELAGERAPASHERKLATMLFVDIVGSTRAAGDQDPERVRATLERFYDAMAEEIGSAGGTADKFAGDAVLAVFGVPCRARGRRGARPARGAVDAAARARALRGRAGRPHRGEHRRRRRRAGPRGELVRDGRRRQCRETIEEAAPAGEILAGDRTAAAVRGAFEFGDPVVVAAKGKPDGVVCRPLLRVLSLQRPRGVLGRQAALVGRERELELAPILAHHYAEAVRPEDHDLAWEGDDGELAHVKARAVGALARAAQLAVGRCELDEGLGFLARALELADAPKVRSGLWREVGRAQALRFDGEAFWTAMQRSLEECPDQATRGDTYSLLAFHTAARSGMWRSRPDRAVVNGWVDRALELSERDSPACARALIARSFTGSPGSATGAPSPAAEASAVADRLGDPELRSYAWDALAAEAFDARRFGEALTLSERRLGLLDEISDPDHITDLYATPVPYCVALGRFEEARTMAQRSDEIASRLSNHHRVHGVSVLLELEELLGEWGRVADLQPRAEATVEANLETPCIRKPFALRALGIVRGDDALIARAHDRFDALGLAWHAAQTETLISLGR